MGPIEGITTMPLMRFDSDFFVPFLVFSIPIVAIVGGIAVGVIRTLGQQRIVELAHRERIAAIERGIDPAKLPPIPSSMGQADDVSAMYLSPNEYAKRRSMHLMTGGVITLFAGIGVGLFLYIVARDDNAWGVGIVPTAVGIGLLVSAALVRPRNGAPPHAS
jgi:hypothetical protein